MTLRRYKWPLTSEEDGGRGAKVSATEENVGRENCVYIPRARRRPNKAKADHECDRVRGTECRAEDIMGAWVLRQDGDVIGISTVQWLHPTRPHRTHFHHCI